MCTGREKERDKKSEGKIWIHDVKFQKKRKGWLRRRFGRIRQE